jgi:N-methylhydantoinase B
MSPVHDPITLEILSNALKSITDETFVALMRSAYSTNIKERNDHSTAIIDAQGRLIAQARQSLPVHISSMSGLVEVLLARRGDEVAEGDIFIANDPYVALGSHLPDINMAMPIFCDGRPVAFMCNIAHHADVGGMAPGSMAGGMTEIYQEGLRIPLVRLFRGGELDKDMFDLLLLNVRAPQERRGDYFAQIAACKLGVRRLGELFERHGTPFVLGAFDEIVGRTERRLRRALGAIPDGSYDFADVMDDDGMGTKDIAIKLRIDKRGERIGFDFTGTARQVAGNINVTLNATVASVCFALKALLDPELPNNQGVLTVPEVTTEKGTLLDCVFPAPVAARSHTCQRIVDVVLGALAPCLPQLAVGGSNGANTTAVFAGNDPRSGQPYVYLETLGGGFGGRASKDGKDAVQVHITNTSNLPIEAIEIEYPLMVEEYGLVEDSGGAGKHRGGMGLRRTIRPVDHVCIFNGAGERFANRPWGVFGGEPGATGRYRLRGDDGAETPLPHKPASVTLRPDQRVVVESPGAGGYGDPAERSADDLARDRRTGKFSAAFLARHYKQLGG